MYIINEAMKFLAMTFAFLLNTRIAVTLIKLAYIERGGWGIGSEYLLIAGLLALTIIMGHKLFAWMDRKIAE